jgi:hypothetical protein
MEQEDAAIDPRIQRIVDEEKLRARIAGSLAAPRKSWLNENSKWLLATIAIPLTTWLFGLYQERVAKVEERVAKAEAHSREVIAMQDRDLERVLGDARNNVSAMTALLPSLSDSDPDRSSLALIVLQQLEKAQHSNDTRFAELSAAVQARIDQLRNSKNPADREKAAYQQEVLSQASGTARTIAPETRPGSTPAPAEVTQATETKPRIVYIQFYEESQRAQAAEVQKLLRSDGVGAPGIEKIAANSRARVGSHPARIYYFNNGDLGGAKWLQQRLAAAGLGDFAIARSEIAGVPAGQIELWWPKAVGSRG